MRCLGSIVGHVAVGALIGATCVVLARWGAAVVCLVGSAVVVIGVALFAGDGRFVWSFLRLVGF